MELLDLFKARQGIVCFVGAGGKKTTMFRLLAEHAGRVGITTTAHIEYFPRRLAATCYVDAEAALLQLVTDDQQSRVIAFATPSERTGRHAGIGLNSVKLFQQQGRFDLLLVKSDGARSRLIKAPKEDEPPLPPDVDTVVPVVSAKVLGRPLNDKVAHRVDRLAAITGARPEAEIEPVHVARLLASNEGALKNAGNAHVVPIINMVDNRQLTGLARQAAEQALALTDRFDEVVLARMRDADPVVEIVSR